MTLSELFLNVAQRLHDKKCRYICYGLHDIGDANADDKELAKLVNRAIGIIMERLEGHAFLASWMFKKHPDLYNQDPGNRERMMHQTRINWCLSLAEEFKGI
jgi:hypothetical protein